MRILYIVPYVPTLIRVRPYNLIRALAQAGVKVTVATLWESEADLKALEDLRAQGIEVLAAPLTRARSLWNSLRALPTRAPIQASYCYSPELERLLTTWLATSATEPVDAIHVEHLRGALYGVRLQRLLAAQQRITPVVWDSVDCISYLFEQSARYNSRLPSRLITRLELGRTRCYEGRLARQFTRVLVTSQVDKMALLQLAGADAPIEVLPNGVDLDTFKPGEPAQRTASVVFSGKMSYHANVTAALYLAEQVMPLVWAWRPDIRLVIAGSRPAPAVRRLPERYGSRVEVTGFLPDLSAPLRTCSVAVAPLLYGAGIQNKVLEAMACATPVVMTPVALAALQAQPEVDCLAGATPQALASAVIRLLSDPALRLQMGLSGRRYVEQHHRWGGIAAQLMSVYAKVSER